MNIIQRVWNAKALREIRAKWGKKENRKRKFDNMKELFSYVKEDNPEEFFINDQTWQDLNMDELFKELDKTLSTPGEQVFYTMLRSPLINEEKLYNRKELIEFFQKNTDTREKVQVELFKLGRQELGILSLIWGQLTGDNVKKLTFNFMALASAALIAALPFLGISAVGFPLFMVLMINMVIHYREKKLTVGQQPAVKYLGAIINTAEKIAKMNISEINEHEEALKRSAAKCKKIAKRTAFLNIGALNGDLLGALTEYIYIAFLVEERAFYAVIDEINRCREELKELYLTLGEIDAIISAASYRASIEKYVEPELEMGKRFIEAENIVHPLIEKPVANSIVMDERGIILTGSNMSGKSTFLRTLGVNALLAQTIYTCTADRYHAGYFRIISSISPDDNLMSGKSYYLGEAEALLNIINSCHKEVPLLSFIDEIFRGTNPVERVAAAVEILNFLIKNNALVLVATHDLELTKIVENYDCYYFREDVDENGLKFDYLIKKGVSPTRNAIRILNYIGYPEDIINKAEARIANGEDEAAAN